jgi:NAD(P)-dependent dehydrogenase (short-subunit alcohol dehydrogenase family)
MNGLVERKVAVITGAASGIGRATAFALAREGAAAVVVADVRSEPREGGKATHDAISCDSRYVECDVTKLADLERAVAAADEFGGIDIMVNNAGIVVVKDFLDFTEEDYDRQMAVNAKGVFFGTQIAARRMVEKGSGVIVNLSSIAGICGVGATSAYSASKGAVKLTTYAAAQALAPRGIRVNAIHPGLVATELVTGDFGLPADAITSAFPVPIGRAAQPEDVADAIVMLCSDATRYMTGASLVVDGGLINTV